MNEGPNMQSLAAARQLFDELEAQQVSYCHWKSNYSLERSLLGEGDLDLLIAEEHRDRFERVLQQLGFIRMLSTGMKQFEGLEDFLGFDHATGQLLHLHVHYRLVLGEKRVKNHHLPVERLLLDASRLYGGVRIPCPEHELLLLYLRSMLKSDARACLRAARHRSNRPFPSGIHEELRWLADQVEDHEVIEIAVTTPLRGQAHDLRQFLARVRSDRLTPSYVLRQKRVVLRALVPFNRYRPATALARKAWFRLAYSRPGRFIRPVPRKRLPARGLYVAVTGADGSGKSTLAVDLQRWLSWKLCCAHRYFGQPKRSAATRAFSLARKLLKAGAATANRVGDRRSRDLLTRAALRTDAIRWLYLARRRARLDANAQQLVHDGYVVVAERFPLRDFWTMQTPMDGPRLNATSQSPGAIAVRERRHYEGLSRPDLVILLTASLQTVRTRKPQTPADEIEAKVQAVQRAARSGRYDVVDAEQPYDHVLLAAKRKVWSHLMRTSHTTRTLGDERAPVQRLDHPSA